MNRDSMKALRFDRRLLRRRGWITPEELERQLESLPDVSPKAQVVQVDDESAGTDAPATGEPERPSGF